MEGINNFLSGFLYIETFIILIIAFYSWKRRKVSGALPLLFLCLGSAIYAFGYGMEITSVSLKEVDFWGKIEYLGLSFIPSLWVIQAHSLSVKDKKISKLRIVALFIIPTLTYIFRLTNGYLHLMYTDMKLVNNGHFYILSYKMCFWYYLYYSFFFICAVISIIMYYKAFLKSEGLARQQLKIMFCVSISVLVFESFDQLQVVPLKMDYGAFIIFFAYVIFAYAVYPFDLMHIVPMSREIIFEWIYDGVLVVDMEFNLKDFNNAAKAIFKSLDKSVVGTKIESCTGECPKFGQLLKGWYEASKAYLERESKGSFEEDIFEFSISSKENVDYFKARPKALYYKGYRVGSTVLISNITKEKNMLLELEKLARFDQLTGMLNRRYFIECADIEFNKIASDAGRGILFMFDIDHFKQINDTHGHQAGDYILKEIAVIARKTIRNEDLLGRYGGEEFIGFLPQLSLKEAMVVIERIRTAFENYTFIYNNIAIKVTASFGVAEYCKQGAESYFSYKEMVRMADLALYKAKENGRNQVAVS